MNELLQDWDDAAADALFTENVALDRPYQERLADLALIRARIGAFTVDAGRPAESDTPAHRRWWLAGERGTVAATIQLNPQRPPRVQSLDPRRPAGRRLGARPGARDRDRVAERRRRGLARRRCRSRRRPTRA